MCQTPRAFRERGLSFGHILKPAQVIAAREYARARFPLMRQIGARPGELDRSGLALLTRSQCAEPAGVSPSALVARRVLICGWAEAVAADEEAATNAYWLIPEMLLEGII